MADDKPIIIIKKKGGHGGHHGGAWKVAYADFVTAMMAFFMVMWLLNSSESRVKEAVASYFRKPGIFEEASQNPIDHQGGAGILPDSYQPPRPDDLFNKWELRKRLPTLAEEIEKQLKEKQRMKGLSEDPPNNELIDSLAPLIPEPPQEQGKALKGLPITTNPPPQGSYSKIVVYPDTGQGGSTQPPQGPNSRSLITDGVIQPKKGEKSDEKEEGIATKDGAKDHGDQKKGANQDSTKNEIKTAQQKSLEEILEEIRQQIEANSELKELLGDIEVNLDANGIEIEIMDTESTSMFESGSDRIRQEVRPAFGKLAEILSPISQKLEVVGHTDAKPFPTQNYSNWDLSTDRANEARRLLTASGIADEKITSVKGRAAMHPRKVEDPTHFSNRRITLRIEFPAQAKPSNTSAEKQQNKDSVNSNASKQQTNKSLPNQKIIPTPRAVSLDQLIKNKKKVTPDDILNSVKQSGTTLQQIPEKSSLSREANEATVIEESNQVLFDSDPIFLDSDWF
jgi:chemotaxis protein MotB